MEPTNLPTTPSTEPPKLPVKLGVEFEATFLPEGEELSISYLGDSQAGFRLPPNYATGFVRLEPWRLDLDIGLKIPFIGYGANTWTRTNFDELESTFDSREYDFSPYDTTFIGAGLLLRPGIKLVDRENFYLKAFVSGSGVGGQLTLDPSASLVNTLTNQYQQENPELQDDDIDEFESNLNTNIFTYNGPFGWAHGAVGLSLGLGKFVEIGANASQIKYPDALMESFIEDSEVNSPGIAWGVYINLTSSNLRK